MRPEVFDALMFLLAGFIAGGVFMCLLLAVAVPRLLDRADRKRREKGWAK